MHLLLGDLQKPGLGPGQPALAGPAWAGLGAGGPPELPASLNLCCAPVIPRSVMLNLPA